MANNRLTGDPDQTHGTVRVADVVRAIRDLEPGFHTVAEVRELYAGTGDLAHVSAVVTKLGLSPYVRGGEKGWTIDPARLARSWPRLPWTD